MRGNIGLAYRLGAQEEERNGIHHDHLGNKDLWQSFTPDQATKAIAEVDAFNRRHKERPAA